MKKTKKKRKAKKLGPLSFDLDDGNDVLSDGHDDTEAAQLAKKKKTAKKIIKNPNVETDFLPDKDRELEEARERERLRAEWEAEQERIKSELLCAGSAAIYPDAGLLHKRHSSLLRCFVFLYR